MSTGLKTGVIAPVLVAGVIGLAPLPAAESEFDKVEFRLPLGVIIINSNSLLQAKSSRQIELASKFRMYVTAYSSSEDETDSTPHVTASGTRTRDGVVATNIFPIGTRIRIPEIFGDQVFTVEDRMHQRFEDRIDIWMPSKWRALSFGKQLAEVEIVEL